MNRRRRLAVLSEHMECRLVLSPTSLAFARLVVDSPDDAAETEQPTDVRDEVVQTQVRDVSRKAPQPDAQPRRQITQPTDRPDAAPVDNAESPPPARDTDSASPVDLPEARPEVQTTRVEARPTTVESPVSTTDGGSAIVDRDVVTPPQDETPPSTEPVQPEAEVVVVVNADPAPVRVVVVETVQPETRSETNAKDVQPADTLTETKPADVVVTEREPTTPPDVTRTEPVRQQPADNTTEADNTVDASTPVSTTRNEITSRPVAITPVRVVPTVDAVPVDAVPVDTAPVDTVDETETDVRPVKTKSRPVTVEPITVTPVDVVPTVDIAATDVRTTIDRNTTTDENVVTTEPIAETEAEPDTRVVTIASIRDVTPTTADSETGTAPVPVITVAETETTKQTPATRDTTTVSQTKPSRADATDDDKTVDESDVTERAVTEIASETVSDRMLPANDAATIVAALITTRQNDSDHSQTQPQISPDTAIPGVTEPESSAPSLPSSPTTHIRLDTTPADSPQHFSLQSNQLTDLAAASGNDMIVSQTLFGDATHVGLMLAAINHAGRRSGTVFGFADLSDEVKNETTVPTKERRRRNLTARRAVNPFNRIRGTVNPLETVDERNTIASVTPSCDALFADAAMMSILFREADRRSSSDGSWQQTTVLGGLAAGGSGLAARKARQLRRKRINAARPRPPKPRSNAKTLIFAD